ncbi:hypothetical protein GCM10010524_29390 [Streptomyces mexicanus]
MHLSGDHVEVDPVEGPDTGELLDDALHLEQRGTHGSPCDAVLDGPAAGTWRFVGLPVRQIEWSLTNGPGGEASEGRTCRAGR